MIVNTKNTKDEIKQFWHIFTYFVESACCIKLLRAR